MSDPNHLSDKPQIELVSDDDWKSKVKAEDARLDAELGKKQPAAPEPDSRTESRTTVDPATLPPPGIDSIIQLFLTQALVAMGIVPDPSGETVRQLPLARHFIDLLGVLEEKTKGNLSVPESRLLTAALHELRMQFVEQSKKG